MDYGRYKYQQEKKEAESRKHQATVNVKEIKLRPNTGQHDIDFKLRHIRRFLEDGDRVKVTIRFRGRQIVHPDLGYDMLNRVAEGCNDLATVEATPRMEGRQLFLLLAPKK
jgi:translation initiation factor IF-3